MFNLYRITTNGRHLNTDIKKVVRASTLPVRIPLRYAGKKVANVITHVQQKNTIIGLTMLAIHVHRGRKHLKRQIIA